MSRFFAGSDSENDSTSSDDDDLQQKPAVNQLAFQFSDEEVEEKRVVRSAKEKRYEGLNNNIKQIKNYKKIKDVSKLLTSFEELQVNYHKARPVIDKEEGGIAPRFFIRCLVEVEDFVSELWEDKEGKKNMQKNSQKSLANLRQKVRKYIKDFEAEVQKYKDNPDAEEDERDEDEEQPDSDSEEDEKPAATGLTADAFKKSVKKDDDDDLSDDESDWGPSTDEESSLSTDDEKYGGNLAAKFLKRATDKDEAEEEKEKKKEKKKKDKEERKKRRDAEDEEGWEEVKGGAPLIMEKPKMFAKDAEISHGLVLKKLNEILAARGKKGTDRSEQIELLSELMSIGEAHNLGPAITVKIQFAIISAIFDYNPNIATCMKSEMWSRLLEHILVLLERLNEHPSITIGENIAEESESLAIPPFRVRGCVLTVVERMEEEFIKMLQACDAHSNEYVERLKDEKTACDIVERIKLYLESRGTSSEICRVYLRNIEHLYYKFDPTVIKQKEIATEAIGKNSLALMNELCQYVYAKDTTDRIRTRAMLCNIYHHALHDNWYEARDLMLMSHLQDSIVHSDIPTQLLYNRTMVQLGLCAFRHGNIKDAHNCLLDIQSGGRAKELLAQGLLLQRQHERSSEQEKIEKRRQMPFHMHINLELLECVYLVSAMLMEIPYMAAHELDTRRRMISKSFHHQLKNSEKQSLVGPPESMREHVVAASKAMRLGNWRACKNYIFNEKMNAKVWDLFYQAEKVREMLTLKIQEESLRTYLFTYSNVYDSISMVTLAEMFELDKPTVHSIISKMIINEELMASLDEPSQTVMMHRTEPSRLQSLALQLADKVATFVENNERILEMKQGSYFSRNLGQQGGGYQRQDRGGYNRNYQNQDNWQPGGYRGYNRNKNQDGGQQQGGYQRGYNRNQEGGQPGGYRGYNRDKNQDGGQQGGYQRGYNRNQDGGNQRQDRGGGGYGNRNQEWSGRGRQRNY